MNYFNFLIKQAIGPMDGTRLGMPAFNRLHKALFPAPGMKSEIPTLKKPSLTSKPKAVAPKQESAVMNVGASD